MNDFNFTVALESFLANLGNKIEVFLPLISGALLVLLAGGLLAIGAYKLTLYAFRKFNLIPLIDRFTQDVRKNEEGKTIVSKLSDKVKINKIIAKAISYYIFLVFFRYAIIVIGIHDVEEFLSELLKYLPSLFIGVVIGFFGIRFSDFIYDIVYGTLNLSKQKTAKIIASGAKIIILFFTLLLVLQYIKIVDEIIIVTIMIGFISMLSLAGGLAFGLGGKEIAKEILESFRK